MEKRNEGIGQQLSKLKNMIISWS